MRDDSDLLNGDTTSIIQRKTNNETQSLFAFLESKQNGFSTSSGDKSTNLIDIRNKRTYCIPEKDIDGFFDKYNKAIRSSSTLLFGFAERQGTDLISHTGLAFDFDIILKENDPKALHPIFNKIICKICQRVIKDLGIPHFAQYAFVITRPQTTPKDDGFKYGFHILIPGIQVSRTYKKYLMKELTMDPAFIKSLERINALTPLEDILDKAYASNPVLLLGSSKPNGFTYSLTSIVRVSDEDGYMETNVIDKKEMDAYNLPWEMSVLYEAKYPDGRPPLVVKNKYDPIESIETTVISYAERAQGGILGDDYLGLTDNDVDYLVATDFQARQVKMLLDILDPEYYEKRDSWLKVIFAVANTSHKYYPLINAFSQRCPQKYNEDDLKKLWENAVSNKYSNSVKNPITLSTLRQLAKLCSPEKYKQAIEKDVVTVLMNFTYSNSGTLGHYHIAKVLSMMFGDRFVVSQVEEGRGFVRAWYEFMFPGQDMEHGELWKWRRYGEPTFLTVFMSEGFEPILSNIMDDIRAKKNDAVDEEKAKYYDTVEKNFKRTKLRLCDSGFKTGVLKECGALLEKRTFANALDVDPTIFGVSNGILKLGHSVELVDRYHEYLVSRFTAVKYRKFNPNHHGTKLMLNFFKTIIPEVDARRFILLSFAGCLDGYPKEPLMSIFTGPGKNAKSTLFIFMKKIFGMYGQDIPSTVLTGAPPSAEKPNESVAQLRGKRMVFAEESDKTNILNSGTVKILNSPGSISVRGLYKSQSSFSVTWLMWLATNFPPMLDAKDYAVLRRIVHYTFKIKFTENPSEAHERIVNPDIASKWAEDDDILEGLLSILVYFYEILHLKYGGNIRKVKSETIERETLDYFNSNDYVNKFVTTMMVESPGVTEKTPLNQIAIMYKTWLTSVENIDKKTQSDTTKIMKELQENPTIQKKFLTNNNGAPCLTRCRILNKDNMALLPGEMSLNVNTKKSVVFGAAEDEPEEWWVLETKGRSKKTTQIIDDDYNAIKTERLLKVRSESEQFYTDLGI